MKVKRYWSDGCGSMLESETGNYVSWDAYKKLQAAANKAKIQMDKFRQYLPSHGSFGCEGIDSYEHAQSLLTEVLE